ncbi:hypothetical protein AA0120_g10631 [Alternaria tenuissima]|uniref:Ubiquitin 3 binding protein But2 C-terminal domain-containing protein n=1 Tax=Alternaria tenuissima TaxID=119927 RepID=A0A4Q4LYP6_9PLEO|nr:hypothetical protein AA0114_g12529 [Alternaria tenuissima]RYN79887.1 hypothetical protein AA0120_g10631 [Alternaria tenuissima]
MRVSALLLVVFGLPAFATLLDTQLPHMLLPLKNSQPDTAFPTQNNATVRYDDRSLDEQWTAVNYDVPDNAANICRLRFLINTDTFKNAPLSLKGEAPFAINISRIEPKLVNGGTTWNNKPAITEHYDTYVLSMNGATEVVSKWFSCPKGNVAQFVIHPASKRYLDVYWFELNYGAEDGGPHGVVLEMHT